MRCISCGEQYKKNDIRNEQFVCQDCNTMLREVFDQDDLLEAIIRCEQQLDACIERCERKLSESKELVNI